MSKLTTEDDRTLLRLLTAIDVFTKQDKDMPIQMVRMMILAALHENDDVYEGKGPGVADLAEKADVSLSVASAHVLGLSHKNRYHEPGHNLLQQNLDPDDRRIRRVTLTQKGQGFVAELLRVLNMHDDTICPPPLGYRPDGTRVDDETYPLTYVSEYDMYFDPGNRKWLTLADMGLDDDFDDDAPGLGDSDQISYVRRR